MVLVVWYKEMLLMCTAACNECSMSEVWSWTASYISDSSFLGKFSGTILSICPSSLAKTFQYENLALCINGMGF